MAMSSTPEPAATSPRAYQVVRGLQGVAPDLLADWWRPVIVPPFPPAGDSEEPPLGTCSDCPEPDRCKADGCHGMDGVVLSDEELRQIG